MRARLAIVRSGQIVELREVDLKNKPQALIDASSKATVPVLVLPDDSVIEESLEIMNWSLQISDPDSWLENMNHELIAENDSTFKKYLDMYKYCRRYPENPQEFYRGEAELFIQKLEHLLTNNLFLSGNKMGYTDASMLPFVRQFADVDSQWFESSQYARVRQWLKLFIESTLFAQIMTKVETWKPDDEQILIQSN